MKAWFGRPRASKSLSDAEAMHDGLIAAIRNPDFYLGHGVADTFEGRFDLLVLLAAVLLRRLRAAQGEGQELAQPLVDTMFGRFDIALRELGVSDIGVPKRMKRLAEAFKGRTAAYDDALERSDVDGLAAAIGRNLLDDRSDGRILAHYIVQADAEFRAADLDDLRRGQLPFPPLGSGSAERANHER